MDELQQCVISAAMELYSQYIEEGLAKPEIPAFKGVGIGYIKFAMIEPKLFQILFMTQKKEKPTLTNILPIIDVNYDKILSSVMLCYSLDTEEAKWLYHHLWIYSHGIAVLCATNICSFRIEEVESLLTEVCMALITKLKVEKKNDSN